MRLRFAPSPTGYLHVGGARTALFNWLLARKHGGVFVLRIEDTDRARSRPELVRAILDGLSWLGLGWDEGPYYQADGTEAHRAAATALLREGKAYRDFSDPDELRAEAAARGIGHPSQLARERADAMEPDEAERRAEAGEAHALRLRVPPGTTVWDDLIHGPMRVEHGDVDDLVVLRSDGTPTYNLAVVCDDAGMGITHVIRGDDHLSNTPKQILLYQALGHELPRFGHVPLILGPDGKRLSKRHGATAVGDYVDEGILPSAMVNFMALLGWSPGDDREVMTLPELVEAFSLERVGKKSAVFDVEKLGWLNGQHLARVPAEELEPLVTPRMHTLLGKPPGERLEGGEAAYLALLDLLKVRARGVHQVADQLAAFLTDPVVPTDEVVARHWKDPSATRERLSRLLETLEAVHPWRSEPLEEALRALAESLGVGAGKLIHPLRVALLGRSESPGIFDVLVVLGRGRSLARLAAALRHPHLHSG